MAGETNPVSKSIGKLAAGALTALLLPAIGAAQTARNRDITIIVASAANGTMDTNARQIAQYFGRHLAGSPNIVVQNMAGASGLVATNYLSEVARPDGRTLYYGTWFPILQALKSPQLKARYDRVGIIGADSETRAVVVRRDLATRIDRPADIAKENGIVVGSTTTGSAQDMLNRMSLDLLGVKYKVVTGYASGPDADMAIIRGEIDLENNSYATIIRQKGAYIQSGKLLTAYYFCTMDQNGAIRRADFIKNTPCYIDLYKEIYGKLPSGELFDALNFYAQAVSEINHLFAAPPDTSPADLAQFRDAYAKTVVEAGFNEFFVKHTGFGPELASLDDAERVLRSVENIDPKVLAVLRRYYESGAK